MARTAQSSSAALLRTDAATKVFRGVKALSAVSVAVDEREILGIIGPNGAGKTTLFNVIAGGIPLTSGRVHFDNRDITKLPPHRRARLGIARTFQLIKPFASLSTYDNIVVGATGGGLSARKARQRADEVIEQMSLHRRARLSAGLLNAVEGKRLEIARALAVGPRVILLDEVFSGLNEDEVVELGAIVRSLPAQGLTVLLIEHNVSAIRSVTQRVIALTAGEIVAAGTPDEVLSDARVVESYLGKHAGT